MLLLLILNIVFALLNLIVYLEGKQQGKERAFNLFVVGFCTMGAITIIISQYL